MKNKLKKIALACGVLAIAAFAVRAAYNSDTETGYNNVKTGNIKITDTGVYDSGGTARYQPGSDNHFTGNLSSSGGQESMGTVGTVLSSLNTSGFSAGQLYYAYLGCTTNAVEGSALIVTGTVSNQVTVCVASTTAGLTSFAGLASAAVSTGSVVGVYSGGSWALALTTGTVVAGDQLAVSSLSAGYLYAPASGTNSLLSSTATVAVALTAGTSSGARTRVRLK